MCVFSEEMSPNYSLLAINQENNTGSNGNDFADKHLKRHFINFILFILGRRVSSISNHFMEKQSFNISTDLPSRILVNVYYHNMFSSVKMYPATKIVCY